MGVKRVHIHVQGRVQGVFFRAMAKTQAESRGLVGWAENKPDGSVEMVAQGDEKNLNTFVAWCRKGPPAAEVTQVITKDESSASELKGFEIRF